MAEKNFNSRIVLKHDTQDNWEKATTFVPKDGELIIYEVDDNYSYPRIKIGDGTTKVGSLPFLPHTEDFADALKTLDFSDPTASGTSTSFIATLSQQDGAITATKKNLPTANGTTLGMVKGSSSDTGDVTITNGLISVKNNSHSHTITNITDLQTTLNSKATPADITNALAALDFTSPTASTTTSTTFIDTVTQADGAVTATKKTIPTANGTTLGMVKGGGDVTIASGVITVTDNSHKHTSANISDLSTTIQSAITTAVEALSASDPTASTTTSTTFIDTISQEDGVITATKKTLPTAGTNLGMVKSGGDVTISSGVISVKDDSHNHIITNVDGLQAALDAKATPANITTAIEALDYSGATASGNSTSFITQVTQTNGVVSATKASVPIATSTQAGLVKSGTDITVDANGNVSVNNNSHSHTASNISDLSSTMTSAINTAIGALDAADPAASGTSTSFISSIKQENGVIVATKANITAASLGLTSAMKFLGVTTTAISNGSTTSSIKIGSSTVTVASGNVVLYGSQEFVWNGSSWTLLGDEGSYKVKQTAINSPSASGNATAFIDTISQDTNGNILATKKNVPAATTTTAGLMSATDKTALEAYKRDDLGSFSGKTIADLRTALENWASGVLNYPGATAGFSCSPWSTLWNAEDLTTTLAAGGLWLVTLESYYTANSYLQLKITQYSDKAVFYVARANNVWKPANQVFFDNSGLAASQLPVSGVTAGTYGLDAAASPAHGGKFMVPKIVVDNKGRVTAAAEYEVTLPADNNTDTKVKQTLIESSTATNWYLLAGTSSTTTTAESVFSSAARLQNLTGSTSTNGRAELVLGNNIKTGVAKNSAGQITLYSPGASYHNIQCDTTDSAIYHTLPSTTGTILNTGSTSATAVYTTGTHIATIKINGGNNKIYMPTASTSQIGGVKVGSNITVSSGAISLSKTNVTTALGYTPYTPTEVDNKIAALVDGAPTTLNTLNKLAAALGDNANFATTVATNIGTKVAKAGDTMTGLLTGLTRNSSWIGATRGGAFRLETAASGGSAATVVSMKTSTGSWGIANLAGSDNLYFVYGTDDNYSTGANTTSNVYIDTNGTYSGAASKLTLSDKGTSTKPIYLVKGVATECSTYAGGTAVTLNGSSKAASTASFYAPTGAGTSGYILKSNGSGAPTWLQTLPATNGGTGHTSAKNAANAFMNALETGSSTPQDADYYISQYVGGGSTTTTYHRRPMSALWTYVKDKMNTDGNAATATKLKTAFTLSLAGAADDSVTIDGSANRTLTIADVKESYLSWGGKNINGGVSPVGAALSAEHSANRLAYFNAAGITVETSNDGGSTWTTASTSDADKVKLVTTSTAITVGTASTVTTNHRTRITFTAQNGTTGYMYTKPRKLLLDVSTPHGLSVTLEAKKGTSGAAWETLGTYTISGWSGWNDIPLSIATIGGGTDQTSNYWYFRLTYTNTSVNSNYKTTLSTVRAIRLFGDTCWTRTSNMGETGHLYSYDENQNATFPAKITSSNNFVLNGATTDRGFVVQHNGYWIGKLIHATIGSTSAGGNCQLVLGNNRTNTSDYNARGSIMMYSPQTTAVTILAHTIDTNYQYYFRNHNQTVYSVGTTTRSAVGEASVPVYVNSNGIITACTSISADAASKDGEGNIITDTYLKLTGGTVSGEVNSSATVATTSAAFRNIKVIAPGTEVVAGTTAIPTGEIWVRYEE